jgi:hypothetical protein
LDPVFDRHHAFVSRRVSQGEGQGEDGKPFSKSWMNLRVGALITYSHPAPLALSLCDGGHRGTGE